MQPWIELVYAIGAVASVVAAILAWIAKIRWSREFAAAKDETIKAKEAQISVLQTEIQNLRELTPMRLREYFTSVKQQYEEYNDTLKAQIDLAQHEITERDQRIAGLSTHGQEQEAQLLALREEKNKLTAHVGTLSAQLESAKASPPNPYPWLDGVTFSRSVAKAVSSTDEVTSFFRNPDIQHVVIDNLDTFKELENKLGTFAIEYEVRREKYLKSTKKQGDSPAEDEETKPSP